MRNLTQFQLHKSNQIKTCFDSETEMGSDLLCVIYIPALEKQQSIEH